MIRIAGISTLRRPLPLGDDIEVFFPQAPRRAANRAESDFGADIMALACPDWRGASIVVETGSLAVLYSNAPARTLLQKHFPVSVDAGRLHFAGPGAELRVHRMIVEAMAHGSETARVVMHDRQSGLTYAIAARMLPGLIRSVLPVRPGTASRLAAIDIVGPEQNPATRDLAAFGRAFSLSPAEESIVALLLVGNSIGEIAQLRRVTIATVRNQAKAILGKTGRRRQSELIKLVMALCPGENGGL